MKKKKVLIKLIANMIIDVPEDWEDYDIDFYLNESSHCLGTEVEQLYKETELNENTCNICCRATGVFIRKATKEDIDYYKPKKLTKGEL